MYFDTLHKGEEKSEAKAYLKRVLEKAGKVEKLEQAWKAISFAQDLEELEGRFSPQAFVDIKKVYTMLEVERELAWKLQQKIDEELYQAHQELNWGNDEDLSEVEAYAIVHKDHVEVTANVTGVGERLPKEGRKYVGGKGDMRWTFPLSQISNLQKCSVISFILYSNGERYRG